MSKQEDKDTRYFVDLDLDTQTILCWDFGQRHELAQRLRNPYHHRLFISKGQYNKLNQRVLELGAKFAHDE